ncbi:short-chain dehydrogenase TIC 32 [Venturia nashicola]|uniref:Short-chain dehydrogenase TIC 32 n=1 Tax=Venturia nashicola TaxID=86259 RepID=A0A4Z1P1L0_9PEZI|nr:short-chain dehydrogenase TIC 32 [Venturia nashicola]TLD34725.1 short-chain dehydrogenase TIC 32 [Venturia nashicola]
MASADINAIPYDAPLGIKEPPFSWVVSQNKKGANGSTQSVPEEDLKSVQGKWIILSGSNNGIGREAAIAFAQNGANLVLACRDPPPHETHPEAVVTECLEAAKKRGHYKTSIEWWPIDSSKLSTVEAFCTRWLDTGRALDILCNNAGIGSSPGGNKVFKTQDGFEIVHQVNLLSHVLITLRLLPSLAKAPAPRVVCTTSCFHYLGKFDLRNFNGGDGAIVGEGVQLYQNNKLYFQVWLTELQRRLLLHPEYKHITVNGVHPGYVNSGIWNVNSNSFLTPVISSVLKTMSYFLGINPQQGSLCLLHAATSLTAGPDPEVQGVGVHGGKGGGRYFSRIWEEEPMPHTRDADCRMRVWRKVNDELKLQEKGLLDVLGLCYEQEPIKAQL